MKLLVAIAALLLETALSPRAFGQDVTHVLPTDRAPMMGYHWWQHASGSERLTAIAVAIQGLRTGWFFGDQANHDAVSAAFNEAYAEHKVSRSAIGIAARPRPMAPPVFTKRLEVYRSKIDDAYARVPSMRKQDVALVLLCFSDSKIITCRDEQGKELR
jgi:hypothetical protein